MLHVYVMLSKIEIGKKSAFKKQRLSWVSNHRVCARGHSAVPLGHGRMYKCGCDYVQVIRKSRWEQITLRWLVNLNLLHSTTDYWGCQVRPEGVQATAEGLAHGGKKVFRY